jgi:MoxR-like ATPase
MMRIRLGYPNKEAELSILKDDPAENQLKRLNPVCSPQEFAAIKALLPTIYCDEKIYAIIQGLLARSRAHEALRLGLSPRSGLMLLKAAKARAIYDGRAYVTSQDISLLAAPVLAHRIKAKPLDFDCSAFIAGEVTDCVHQIEG